MLDYKVLENELNSIEDVRIFYFTKHMLFQLPNYFYHIPASSTGKYHPRYALGDGGLARHVKAAVMIAQELFKMEEYNFTQYQKDIIISALLVHDGYKQGFDEAGRTVSEHPIICFKQIMKENFLCLILSPITAIRIAFAVLTHMGQWNKNWDGKWIMPKPVTKLQKFVHLCDYLASRKFLEVNFKKEEEEQK
jgi:hypothetical protein